MTVTDYPDYATSQDHANKIAATGVPLLHLKTPLATVPSTPVTVGTPLTLPTAAMFYNFTQVAYEIIVTVSTAAATSTRAGVQLIWSDSLSALGIIKENISIYAGAATGPHSITGHGPTRADRLQIVVSAPDNNVNVSAVILESSRVWKRSRWRTTFGALTPTFPGFTSSIVDPDGAWLASVNSSVPASNSPATLMPLYTGLVKVAGATTDSVAGNSEIRINDTAEVFATPASTTLYRIANGQGESFKPGIILASALILPASQCQLVQSNGNTTTAETINANVLADEYGAA